MKMRSFRVAVFSWQMSYRSTTRAIAVLSALAIVFGQSTPAPPI